MYVCTFIKYFSESKIEKKLSVPNKCTCKIPSLSNDQNQFLQANKKLFERKLGKRKCTFIRYFSVPKSESKLTAFLFLFALLPIAFVTH